MSELSCFRTEANDMQLVTTQCAQRAAVSFSTRSPAKRVRVDMNKEPHGEPCGPLFGRKERMIRSRKVSKLVHAPEGFASSKVMVSVTLPSPR